MPCKHFEMIQKYANEIVPKYEKPWEQVEYRCPQYNIARWKTAEIHPCWWSNYEYRFKPQTIRIGDYDLPKPETEEPESGTLYYFIDIKKQCGYSIGKWDGVTWEIHLLENGGIHLSEKAVLEWVKWWKETVIGQLK